MDAISERKLQAFVYHEARLLDERRFDEWLALFTPDGRYWVPLNGSAQVDDGLSNSIADEDYLLLSLRIERLKNPRAHSQHPASNGQHVLQQASLEHSDPQAGRYELRSPFVYTEAHGADQIVLSGHYYHRLLVDEGRLRIQLKRVNLLNSGAPLSAVQLFP
jgi:3-phenylpropionate/cinnamic acid dioxygenase small subunit